MTQVYSAAIHEAASGLLEYVLGKGPYAEKYVFEFLEQHQLTSRDDIIQVTSLAIATCRHWQGKFEDRHPSFISFADLSEVHNRYSLADDSLFTVYDLATNSELRTDKAHFDELSRDIGRLMEANTQWGREPYTD